MSDQQAALDFEYTRAEFEQATAHFSKATFAMDEEEGIYMHPPHHHRWEGWIAAHAKFFDIAVNNSNELSRLNAKISELEAENRNLKMNHSLKPTLAEALTTLMENKE